MLCGIRRTKCIPAISAARQSSIEELNISNGFYSDLNEFTYITSLAAGVEYNTKFRRLRITDGCGFMEGIDRLPRRIHFES